MAQTVAVHSDLMSRLLLHQNCIDSTALPSGVETKHKQSILVLLSSEATPQKKQLWCLLFLQNFKTDYHQLAKFGPCHFLFYIEEIILLVLGFCLDGSLVLSSTGTNSNNSVLLRKITSLRTLYSRFISIMLDFVIYFSDYSLITKFLLFLSSL